MSNSKVEKNFNDIIDLMLEMDKLPKEENAISEYEIFEPEEKLDYCICPSPAPPTPPPPPQPHDKCNSTKKICYKPCEFCKTVKTRPIDLNKCTDRLLKIKVTIDNVCFNKEISVGVILCDCHGKIIDFKCFTAELHRDGHSCCDKGCGKLIRRVTFTIPKSDACSSLELTARVVVNYTSPCCD